MGVGWLTGGGVGFVAAIYSRAFWRCCGVKHNETSVMGGASAITPDDTVIRRSANPRSAL